MGEQAVLSRTRADGSRDLWVHGWQVHCPSDAQPAIWRSDPPEDAAPAADVVFTALEDGFTLQCGDWIVMVHGGESRVISATPHRPRQRYYYYRNPQ